MKNIRLIILLTCFLTSYTHASHIVGGEVYYDTVGLDGSGNMVYNVTFELF